MPSIQKHYDTGISVFDGPCDDETGSKSGSQEESSQFSDQIPPDDVDASDESSSKVEVVFVKKNKSAALMNFMYSLTGPKAMKSSRKHQNLWKRSIFLIVHMFVIEHHTTITIQQKEMTYWKLMTVVLMNWR